MCRSGKILTLKSDDTDIETNGRQQRPRTQRFRRYRYGNQRQRPQSNTDDRNVNFFIFLENC